MSTSDSIIICHRCGVGYFHHVHLCDSPLLLPGYEATLASAHQPDPTPGKQEVAKFVLQDIQERIGAGYKKYGTKLMTHNGRDALWDAYQEAIDLVMYLRQAILERGGIKPADSANSIPANE